MKPLLGQREHHLKCHWIYAKKAKNGKNRPLPGLGRWVQGSTPVVSKPLSIRTTTLKSSGRSLTSTSHPIPEARPHPPSEAVKMDVFTEFRRGKTI